MNLTASGPGGLALAAVLIAGSASGDDLKDLYYGEAVYHANQGHYFEALERLDTELVQHKGLDEPELDTLYHHIGEADFSVGNFDLRYRMHHRAGRAIRAVLEAAVDDVVRNDAAYRLARIHFQKGQLPEALHALDRIEGRVPESIEDDIEFLRANVYLAEGIKEAVGPDVPVIAVYTPVPGTPDFFKFVQALRKSARLHYQQKFRFAKAGTPSVGAGIDSRGRS